MCIYQLFRFSLFLSVSIYFLPLTLSLNCYSCYFSYNEVFDADNVNQWCTNGTLKLKDETEVVKPCANWEKYCITSITTMLNSFTSVQRQCGTRCQKNCDNVGYGNSRITCYSCCKKDKCNDEYSLNFYQKVMSQQYTHWTVPVRGEKEFNKKKRFIFPY
uniref:Snake toxin/toxin-like domain-containing protein n=1 Tax=Acrobeloides nanus TaxID=290746 RepID=A0A914DI55_9BILA